jgi:hypothetical protein
MPKRYRSQSVEQQCNHFGTSASMNNDGHEQIMEKVKKAILVVDGSVEQIAECILLLATAFAEVEIRGSEHGAISEMTILQDKKPHTPIKRALRRPP